MFERAERMQSDDERRPRRAETRREHAGERPSPRVQPAPQLQGLGPSIRRQRVCGAPPVRRARSSGNQRHRTGTGLLFRRRTGHGGEEARPHQSDSGTPKERDRHPADGALPKRCAVVSRKNY
jgi:hypothetical protein